MNHAHFKLTNHTMVASLWEGKITVYPLEKN